MAVLDMIGWLERAHAERSEEREKGAKTGLRQSRQSQSVSRQ